MRFVVCFVLIVLIGSPETAAASIFGFGKKSRKKYSNEGDRVMQLIHSLKNSRAPSERAAAVEELGQMDVGEFPEIVIHLIEATQMDGSSKVRAAAVDALSRIRPPRQDVAQALDRVSENDASLLVRMKARTAKFGYRVAEFWSEESPATPFKPMPMPTPDSHRSAKQAREKISTPGAMPASATPMLKAPPSIYRYEPKRIGPAALPSKPLLLDENSPPSDNPPGILSAPR